MKAMTVSDHTTWQANFNPARVFLFLALLIGTIYCVIIPYGAGYDEERHIVRIYDISLGYLLPNRNPPTYKSTITLKEFSDLSYQRRIVQSPAFDMYSREVFLKRFGRQEENLVYGYIAGSIYSPVMFLPQALVARLFWSRFDLPILPIVILMRVAGLCVYIAGCWLAIRTAPMGQWVMAVLALSPMALFQAATLNTDGFTNAASFLFIALVLRLYWSEPAEVQPRLLWAVAGSALLLGLAKPGAVILLPLLLILSKKHLTTRNSLLILGTGALLAVIVNAGWMLLAMPNSKFAAGGSDSFSRQFALVGSHVADFIVTYVQGTLNSLIPYARDWMASYGYRAGIVPGPVYLFYSVLLWIAVLAEPRSARLSLKARSIMIGLFLLASSTLMTLYFVVYYSPGDASALGRHGRYFIPFAPLLFIALSGLITADRKWEKSMAVIAGTAFLVVVGGYTFGIYTTYYTDCGYQAYIGEKCELPIFKNLEKEGAPTVQVNSDTPVSQTFTSQCNNLEAVQVFVNSVPAGEAGSFTFALLDGQQQTIVSKELEISSIQAGEYLTLPIVPATGVKNTTYEIRLDSSDLPATSAGLGLSYVLGGFHEGSLTVAGKSIPHDLIFHYTCTRP